MNRSDRGLRLLAAGIGLGVATLVVSRRLSRTDEDELPSDRRSAPRRSGGARPSARAVEAITINAPLERVEERWDHAPGVPESLRRLTRARDAADGRAIVQFRPAPANRGTEVRVEIRPHPGGMVAAAIARLSGADPTGRLREDLRRFKQIVETGEVLVSEGPSLWRAGRPAEDPRDIRRASGVGVSR